MFCCFMASDSLPGKVKSCVDITVRISTLQMQSKTEHLFCCSSMQSIKSLCSIGLLLIPVATSVVIGTKLGSGKSCGESRDILLGRLSNSKQIHHEVPNVFCSITHPISSINCKVSYVFTGAFSPLTYVCGGALNPVASRLCSPRCPVTNSVHGISASISNPLTGIDSCFANS